MARSLSAKSTLAVCFPLLMVAFSAHAGTVVFVDADADGANDGSNWKDAYTDLQDALAEAVDSGGDITEIWVAEGMYSPAPPAGDRTVTFQLLSGVALYGGFSGAETELDQRDWDINVTFLSGDLNGDDGDDFANNAENSYHVVTGSETAATAVLDGFTITAGHADGVFPHESGAGLDNLYGSPTVANCRFVANVAQSGGGLYNQDSSPTLTNCAFEGNVGTSVGGGIYNISHSSPVITNCTFVANSAGYHGGGMDNYDNSSPSLIGCTFSENSADMAGGGMHSHFQSNPTLIDCTFRLNSVAAELGSGGGLYSDYGETTLINCVFGANSATGPYSAGGAVYSDTGELTMTNCTFSGNTAEYGAAFMNEVSLAVLTNCTLSGNHAQEVGGGVYNLYGLTIVSNCILWGNTDSGGTTEPAQIYANGSTTVTYTCIQGLDTFAGNGNIAAR